MFCFSGCASIKTRKNVNTAGVAVGAVGGATILIGAVGMIPRYSPDHSNTFYSTTPNYTVAVPLLVTGAVVGLVGLIMALVR